MPVCLETIAAPGLDTVPSPVKGPAVHSISAGDPGRDAVRWNSAVSAMAGHNTFYSAEWAQVLSDTYGYKPLYFSAYQAGQPTGCLPVMEVDSWLTGRRGVSLPFADDCGPLGAGDAVDRLLIERALLLGRERNWRWFECRGSFSQGFPEVPTVGCWGHRLDLAAGADAAFSRFDGAVRRAIRKADKERVEVEITNGISGLREYYRLHCLTRKRHGVPPQPWRFFEGIHRHLLERKMGFVVLARYLGQVIAGAVYLHWGRQGIFKFGASDNRFQQLRANNLVMWRAIQWLGRNGGETLDLGRTTEDNSGLRRFKNGWGASEYRMFYLKYDYRRGRFVTSGRGRGHWPEYALRKLPIPLARLVGAFLYRHYA